LDLLGPPWTSLDLLGPPWFSSYKESFAADRFRYAKSVDADRFGYAKNVNLPPDTILHFAFKESYLLDNF
jgi:hypothetical protein